MVSDPGENSQGGRGGNSRWAEAKENKQLEDCAQAFVCDNEWLNEWQKRLYLVE